MSGVRFAACTAGAFAAAGLCVILFNKFPANWFCDYGEQPEDKLYGIRLKFRPHGILMALLLTASFLCLYAQYGESFYFFAGCFAGAVLLLIAAADLKYRIIPDQFTFALFLTALVTSCYDLLSGHRIYHSGWLSPVLGAVVGCSLMLVLGLAGQLFYKKEALGFGDVKLFGAIGLLTGFPHLFFVFLLTIFLAFFHIVFLLFRKKITKDLYLPFGPYICLALLLFLAFHRQIDCFAGWYLSLLNL
jgi:prepilin signal peptidase PulO-like enzyme (type II secretory pathway)